MQERVGLPTMKIDFNHLDNPQGPAGEQRATPSKNDLIENMAIIKNHWNILRTGLIACFSCCMQMGFGQALQTIT
ncbi:MAG: hypothetical protein WBO39_04360, partial [Ferruginibacter sp.]